LHAQPTRLHAQSLKQIADAVKAHCSRLFYSQEEADAKQAHYQVSLPCAAAAAASGGGLLDGMVSVRPFL
jgi:hypothetical protein